MGWTVPHPYDDSTDWSRVDYVNQFIEAVFERSQFLRGSGYLGPQVPGDLEPWIYEGYDLSSASSSSSTRIIWEMQRTLQDSAQSSISSSEYNDDTKILPAFDHETTINVAVFDGRVSYHEGWWTRKFPREGVYYNQYSPGEEGWVGRDHLDKKIYLYQGGAWVIHPDQTTDPDLLVDYGTMQPGDYIGPWIWNEMYAVINMLEHFSLYISYLSAYKAGFGTGATLSAAYDAAKADYDDGPWVLPGPSDYNRAKSSVSFDNNGGPGDGVSCLIQRRRVINWARAQTHNYTSSTDGLPPGKTTYPSLYVIGAECKQMVSPDTIFGPPTEEAVGLTEGVIAANTTTIPSHEYFKLWLPVETAAPPFPSNANPAATYVDQASDYGAEWEIRTIGIKIKPALRYHA